MKQFRKKPIVIEAVRFVPGISVAEATRIAEWCRGRPWLSHDDDVIGLEIPTLEGIMSASPGDWIIKGVQGEFYPCKPDIFALTYEPADQADDRRERFFEAAKRVAAKMSRRGAGKRYSSNPDDHDLITAYLDLVSHGEPEVPAGPGGYQPQ